MRLHALITPPPVVLQHLRAALDDIAPRSPDVPWAAPERWSCRLASFGNLGLHELTIVTRTLVEIGTYCPPLTLRLTGGEARPADESAEHLGVAMSGDLADLRSLADAIPSMVRPHGLFLDRRSFRPVVSLAMGAREPFDARVALSGLRGYSGPEWTATEMRLVRLIPRGVEEGGFDDIEDVARYPFSAPIETTSPAPAHMST